MKKALSFLLAVVILTILLTACGNVAHVTRTKVDSDYFTQEEIDDAIDVIVDYFRREFDGCTLPTAKAEQQQGLGKALPNKIPCRANEQKTKFGPMVESCSQQRP